MASSGSEEAQSFLLRFWHERSLMNADHWRGTFWDQKQGPEHAPKPVGSPEEAFSLVRLALAKAGPVVAEPEDAGAPRSADASPEPPPGGWARLARGLRRFFGAEP